MSTTNAIPTEVSAADYLDTKAVKRKYHNEPTIVDGVKFSSRAEARRYCELKIMLDAGVIKDLRLQPRFPIVVNGIKICTYVADFRYYDIERGGDIIEDVKSTATKTAVYRVKAKLMHAVYGVIVSEVMT
jgi:hypothetical protein